MFQTAAQHNNDYKPLKLISQMPRGFKLTPRNYKRAGNYFDYLMTGLAASATALRLIDPKETRNKILASCSCIKGLRTFGVYIPLNTNAKDLKPNSMPVVGRVVLFNYSGVYHAALITSMNTESFSIKETNFIKCKYSERKIGKQTHQFVIDGLE